MKTKIIPKMLSGGGMPPFTYYTPVTVSDTSGLDGGTLQAAIASSLRKKSSSDDSTKGLITDKDLLEMVAKIDGLPNDMNNLVKNLNKFYLVGNLFSNGTVNTSLLSSRYLSTLQKLKVANFNKKEYDKAYEKVNALGGLSELAITDTGRVVVRDSEGEIKQISSLEYLNNKDSYQALTNSNLLYMRAHSPELSYKNEILGVVENGIGIPTVTKIIEDAIGNLGTATISKSGYSYKKADLVLKGVEILLEAANKGVSIEGMTLEGMYKNKLLTKDLYAQAKLAVQYIYETLPTNAHTLLEIKSGNASNPRQGALDLITNLVISRTSTTVDFDTDYLDDLNPDGTKKSSTSSKEGLDDVKSNPILDIIQGVGGEYMPFKLNTGTNTQMSVEGIGYDLQNMSDHIHIPTTSLEKALSLSGLYGVISQNGAVTFGDQLLNNEDLKNVVYRGKGITRVILPSRLVDGKVVPDFSIMDEYSKALAEIIKIPESLPEGELKKKQGEILYKYGLLELLDPNTGLPNLDRFSLFAVADAYGTSKDDVIHDSLFVEEVTNADDKLYQELNAALSDKDNPQELDQFNMFNPLDWFGNYDKIYKASVYIPLNNNKLQAITAYGDLIKYPNALKQEEYYQRFQKLQLARSTGTSNL